MAESGNASPRAAQRPFDEVLAVERSYLADTIYGKIMRCRVKATGALVAIKVYERARAASHRTRSGHTVLEDAATELAILRELGDRPHPHLMGEHACGPTLQPGLRVDYGAMQYADGGDMLTYLRGHNISTDVARRHFVRIASAVQHLHHMGWAHRDVSLENVLLVTETGADGPAVDGGVRPLLGDYGLAVRLGDCPAPVASRPGKPGYMCPEIYAFKPYNSAAADVYSLGVVLFGLLARALPYNAPTHNDVAFRMIQAGQLADLLHAWSLTSRFRDGAMDLVERMLARDPSKRPTLREVLQHPWCAPALKECGVCVDAPAAVPVAPEACHGSDEEETKAGSVGTLSVGDSVETEASAAAPAPAPAPASQKQVTASHAAHDSCRARSDGLSDGVDLDDVIESEDDCDDSDSGSVASPLVECEACVCDASMSRDDMQRALGRVGGESPVKGPANAQSDVDEVGAQTPDAKGARHTSASNSCGDASAKADAVRAAGAAHSLAQATARAPKPPVDAGTQQQQQEQPEHHQQEQHESVCPTPVTAQQPDTACDLQANAPPAVASVPRHRHHMRQPLDDQAIVVVHQHRDGAHSAVAKSGVRPGTASNDRPLSERVDAVAVDTAA